MGLYQSALRWLVRCGSSRLAVPELESAAAHALQRIASQGSPEEALSALLRLDHRLYKLEGQAAIRYGRGVHPKHRLTHYHDFFVARIRASERVLDVGCGAGELTLDIAERAGAEVVGLDFDGEYIRSARHNRPHPRVSYVLGDVNQVLPSGPFDVVVLSNVLEHIRDRRQLLERLRAELAPHRILVRVPCYERDWRVPAKRELGIEWRLDPTHETEYTVESFGAEVAAARLQVSELQVRWGEIWAVLRDRSSSAAVAR